MSSGKLSFGNSLVVTGPVIGVSERNIDCFSIRWPSIVKQLPGIFFLVVIGEESTPVQIKKVENKGISQNTGQQTGEVLFHISSSRQYEITFLSS